MIIRMTASLPACLILHNTTRWRLLRVFLTSHGGCFPPHMTGCLSNCHMDTLGDDCECPSTLLKTRQRLSQTAVSLAAHLPSCQPFSYWFYHWQPDNHREPSHWSIIRLLSYCLRCARQTDYMHDSWEEWHCAYCSWWRKPVTKVSSFLG